MATRITLDNDQWIDVKDELTMKDEREIHTYSSDGVSYDGGDKYHYNINAVKSQLAVVAGWAVNWHLTKNDRQIHFPAGKASFKEKTDALETLGKKAFRPIYKAVDAHAKTVDGDSEEKKDETQSGETDSGPTLPSAS